MTAYNEEHQIIRSINSILNQTFKDFEFIIIDDGSIDKTVELVRQVEDSRIKLYTPGRLGFTKALNFGIRNSVGQYIARMDADDESLPQRFEKQIEYLDQHPEISILGTAYIKNDSMRVEKYTRYPPESDEEIKLSMAYQIPICHGSVMFRKNFFESIEGYNENIPDEEDLELWIRAAVKGYKFANLQIPLYIYWFDPKTSFFEATLGRRKRAINNIKLSAKAINQMHLPFYYYSILVAKLFYYFLLPTKIKTFARRIISKSKEVRI